MSVVIHRGGSPLDHVALGFPDAREGVALVEEMTGIAVELRDPEPGEWWWSGAMFLGEGRMLEILGPNPEHPPDNPFAFALPNLAEPQLVFWYVGVSDADAFERDLARVGLSRLDRVDVLDGDFRYKRGIVGPDYDYVMPMYIEWLTPPPDDGQAEQADLRTWTITSPRAVDLRAAFAELGIEQRVDEGDVSRLELTIATPKGDVTYSGEWPLKLRG